MATKEEILSTFDSKEGAWWAYKEGIQTSYNEAFNSLRNQAAIAAMQGLLSCQNYPADWATLAEDSVKLANCLIEELKKK